VCPNVDRPGCVRNGVVQDRFSEVTSVVRVNGGKIDTEYSYLDSMAYPPRAQDDKTPLHVPIAIGSAVW